MFSNGSLHMDMAVLTDQQKITLISFVQTLDAVLRTYLKWWLIGTDSEKKSKESVLLACLDDEDDDSC